MAVDSDNLRTRGTVMRAYKDVLVTSQSLRNLEDDEGKYGEKSELQEQTPKHLKPYIFSKDEKRSSTQKVRSGGGGTTRPRG